MQYADDLYEVILNIFILWVQIISRNDHEMVINLPCMSYVYYTLTGFMACQHLQMCFLRKPDEDHIHIPVYHAIFTGRV